MFGKKYDSTQWDISEHEYTFDVLACVCVAVFLVLDPTGGVTGGSSHAFRNTLGSLSYVQWKKSQLKLRHLKSSSGFFMHTLQVSLSLSSGFEPKLLAALPPLLCCGSL